MVTGGSIKTVIFVLNHFIYVNGKFTVKNWYCMRELETDTV